MSEHKIGCVQHDCDECENLKHDLNSYIEEANKNATEIIGLQERLALAQLNEVRFRGISTKIEDVHTKLKSVNRDYNVEHIIHGILEIKQALSIPPNRTDLDAYVEAQFGEPVAFAVPGFKDVMEIRDGHTLVSKAKTDLHCLPLYAKKG